MLLTARRPGNEPGFLYEPFLFKTIRTPQVCGRSCAQHLKVAHLSTA